MSSNTKTVDTTDHVVLDGMYDDKATKCWLRLLRHGIAFRIDASADNLEGTALHRQWQELFENAVDPGTTSNDNFDRWDQLCDLLIETSLPVLQQLAPRVAQDQSLRSCFYTTTYHLQLLRDSVSQKVQASVSSGPFDESPYGFQAAKEEDLGAFGAGLEQHSLRDVEILGTKTRPSMPLQQVKTLDGTVHRFVACAQDSKRLGTDHISNHSRDAIRAYLQLHKNPLKVTGIPTVSGVVVDDDALAGILLQDIQAAETLATRFDFVTVKRIEAVRQLVPGWQARISSVVAALHNRGYYLHDEISECGIDESTLFVDEGDEIWLPFSQIFQQSEKVDRSSELMKKDEEAVRQVFEKYVPEKLATLEAQTKST